MEHFLDLEELVDAVELKKGGIEAMIEKLENKGYLVYEKDPQKELLEEMYYNAIYFNPKEFLKYVNNMFKTRLEKWI